MQELTKVQASNYAKGEKLFRDLLKDDFDKFDLKSEWDHSLSYSENKKILIDKVNVLFKLEDSLVENVNKAKADQERLDNERRMQAEKEVEEYNKKLVYTENKELEKYYEPIYSAVSKMAQGYCKLLCVEGPPGHAKSFNIRRALVLNKMDYFVVKGVCTPAYLYRLLFENRKKTIWFNDSHKVLNNQDSLNFLKSAAECEDVRLLTKSSYSKAQEDLPDSFIFEGNFIFDYNQTANAQLRADMDAFASRGNYVYLAFYIEEIKQIMRLIANSEEDKEVTEHVIKRFEENGLIKLNLRTQKKAFDTYKWSQANSKDWKQEIDNELKKTSKIRSMLYSLIGNEIVQSSKLKKLMLQHGLINTLRTADNKVADYVAMDELYIHNDAERNFYISINPKKVNN